LVEWLNGRLVEWLIGWERWVWPSHLLTFWFSDLLTFLLSLSLQRRSSASCIT